MTTADDVVAVLPAAVDPTPRAQPRLEPLSATWARPASQTASDAPGVRFRLDELGRKLADIRPTIIGFPSTADLDISPLWPMFNQLLNNVGDPYSPSAFPANTKAIEREVVEWFADLLRAPEDDRWGYVTTGGTEGTEFGLLQARTLQPDTILVYSSAAHYSVPKLAAKLCLTSVAIRSCDDGRIDLRDLRTVLRSYRDRPVAVLATIGTTMSEAVDDVRSIRRVLAEIPNPRAYIHADAALSGLPLAMLPPQARPGFDLADGADSVSISGHKFLGAPFPCGVVLTRRTLKERMSATVDMLNTHDSTIGGSRSGHAPLVLWYAIHRFDLDELRQRAEDGRALAQYTVDKLRDVGWPAWRHPQAMTVVIDAPPTDVLTRWAMPVSGNRSHIVCLPGMSRAQIDAFTSDLATTHAATATRDHPSAGQKPHNRVRDKE